MQRKLHGYFGSQRGWSTDQSLGVDEDAVRRPTFWKLLLANLLYIPNPIQSSLYCKIRNATETLWNDILREITYVDWKF